MPTADEKLQLAAAKRLAKQEELAAKVDAKHSRAESRLKSRNAAAMGGGDSLNENEPTNLSLMKRRPSVTLTGTEVGGGGKSTKGILYG